MPATVGCAAGFGAYLVAAAGVTALAPDHRLGVAVLLVIAALIGYWTSLPGAALVGLLGWPFYSGFVTHGEGVLAVTGVSDGVVAATLVAAAVLASLLHNGITRIQAHVPRVAVDIPAQRRPAEHLQHL